MADASEDRNPTEAIEPPTRTRFFVLGMLCILAGILYMDRICISSALELIEADLKIKPTQMSYILMAFTLAYGLFELPTGRWGDRVGGRRVLTRISLWWSAFTAMTGACSGLTTMIVVRFLFGAGEAGAFPNMARVLSRWFPDHERGRAQGVLFAASQAGGAFAPYIATRLILLVGWRWTFAIFGTVGSFWAVWFWWWFRDDPAKHPKVNSTEAAYIGRRATAGDVHSEIPWVAVIQNRSVWLLSTIMTLASFNSYIYLSWFQRYLESGRGIEKLIAGTMASTVLAFSAAGTLSGGFVVDWIVRDDFMRNRRLFGGGCFFGAAAMLMCALKNTDPWLATLFAALSCFLTQATLPLWWSSVIGISGKHVGALFGLMNSAGVFGGMAAQYLVGAIADKLENAGYSGRAQWDPIFYIDLVVLVAAGVLWSSFRYVAVKSDEEIVTDPSATPTQI